jgi:hypothetical protein
MKILGLLFLPLAYSLTCPASYAQVSPVSYVDLNGNWRLSTGGGAFEHPDQYFTLGVYGSTIFAQGTLSLSCTRDGKPLPIEPGVYLRGEIRPDGSFTLDNKESPTGTTARGTTVTGKLPTAGRWSGSITVPAFQYQPPGQSLRDCPAASGDFAATPLPLVDGTYSGVIYTGKPEADGYVTLTISQGQFSPKSCAGRTGREIQVRGRIVVTGSSQFPSGAFETEGDLCASNIYGSRFQIGFFHKGDSADLSANGKIDFSDDGHIQLTLHYVHRDETGKFASPIGFVPLTRDDNKASR